MTIQILDVYQGNKFDAVQEKNTGTDAVLIKAGQGEYQDYIAHKCNYIEQCDRIDLPWGVFWQMDARYSPEKHKAALKEFDTAIGFGTLGLWLACEKPFYPCPDAVYNRMPHAFYKPIESVWRGMFNLTGEYPGIYTSPGMWKLIFGACPLPLQREFAESAKLWVAQYKVLQPDKIGQWEKFWLWQYQAEPDYSICSNDEQFKLLYLDELPPLASNDGNSEAYPADGDAAHTSPDRIAILDEAIKAIEAIK